jgi:hypothetical protein
MGTDQIMYIIVALILGMLLANMLKDVCGCTVVEGQHHTRPTQAEAQATADDAILRESYTVCASQVRGNPQHKDDLAAALLRLCGENKWDDVV